MPCVRKYERVFVRCSEAQAGHLIDHVPYSHWITTTVISALRNDEVFAVCVIDGVMNHAKFIDYTDYFH